MMNKPDINPQKLDQAALFRYELVSRVLILERGGMVRPAAVGAVAETEHVDTKGSTKRVSVRTLYRWIAAFESLGIKGLCRKPSQKAKGDIIPMALAGFLVSEKADDPRASIPELIRRCKVKGLGGADNLDRTTVWRFFRDRGIDTTRVKKKSKDGLHRFAFAHRMAFVLCDGKHFRAGPNRNKRVVLFYLDDATRLVLGAAVGPSENHLLFLRGLYRCVHEYGLMQCLFTDNGSGFIAHESKSVMANLGVHYIQGRPGHPQGRGKVERFNRTAFEDVIRHLDRNAWVDPDCAALELRINQYLSQIYNCRPHHALDGMTPMDRFRGDITPLRFIDQATLADHFRLPLRRRVGKDQIISVDGLQYEMPVGYAQTWVTLSRDLLGQRLEFIHQGRRITLHPHDPHHHAHRPMNPNGPSQRPSEDPATTAGSAHMMYQQQFQPLVDGEGNYYDSKETDHDPIS